MITIKLKKQIDGYYYPVTDANKALMQHCANEDLDCLNEKGLDKCKQVATAHGWFIEIV
jgi:hypothetical protein